MAKISLRPYVPLLDSNSVLGMAHKVGLSPPPPSISVRQIADLAALIIKPFAPTNLEPRDGTTGVSSSPFLTFTDPGEGTPAAALFYTFLVSQNNILVGSPPLTGPGSTAAPLRPPGAHWFRDLPNGVVMLEVWGENRAGRGPATRSVFTVGVSAPAPTPPPPLPTPPPNLVGISKLSLFNCQQERHTVLIWVRDVTGNGPWGQIQAIPSQFNNSGQCPFDDNGILADSHAILTRKGEGGGFPCTSGNVYQVSIVDPELPGCDGRIEPNILNCVVESMPSFFKFDVAGDELVVMLENGRLSPAPV